MKLSYVSKKWLHMGHFTWSAYSTVESHASYDGDGHACLLSRMELSVLPAGTVLYTGSAFTHRPGMVSETRPEAR